MLIWQQAGWFRRTTRSGNFARLLDQRSDLLLLRRRPSSNLRAFSASSASSSSATAAHREDADLEEFDVLIVGGGVVGAALARLLQPLPSIRIGLIEAVAAGNKGPIPVIGNDDAPPHPRSYALSPASLQLLGIDRSASGKNPRMQGYYQSMQVWEANQPASLLWSSKDLPPRQQQQSDSDNDSVDADFLGCCIEDSVLTEHLWEQLQNKTNVSVFSGTLLQNLQWPSDNSNDGGWVQGSLVPSKPPKDDEKTEIAPDASKFVRTRLLVAADGANSCIRKVAGIPMMTYQYGQTAVTFTVKLERPLEGRAFQRFLATGPLALLPTFSPQHAVVVWSTTPEEAAHWRGEDSGPLTAHLNALLQAGPEQLAPLLGRKSEQTGSLWNNLIYGIDKVVDTVQYGAAMAAQQQIWDDDKGTGFQSPPVLDGVVSNKFVFPLQCQLPAQQQYCVGNHLALVGDAAHSVHPMAGQGLNLGLQDVAALVTVIEKAVGSGMDAGTFLLEYQASRQKQVALTVSGIHGLQRLFAGQSTVSKHLKSLGMSVLQNVGPARRAVVQAATQGVAVP